MHFADVIYIIGSFVEPFVVQTVVDDDEHVHKDANYIKYVLRFFVRQEAKIFKEIQYLF
jgi:hypothetical protein